MKKIFYTLLIGLCIGKISVNAQTTFNKLYPAIGATDIKVLNNNSFVFIGLANSPIRLIGISTLNSQGVEINRDTLRFRPYSIDEARYYNTTIKTSDNNYLMAAVIERNCTNCKEGILVKFNSTLSDTLWTRTYKYSNINAGINTITEDTATQRIYVTGDTFVNNVAFSFFACFDANGNLLWEKPYDPISTVFEYTEHIEVVGNYLVLGGQQWIPNQVNSTNGFVAVYDLNGNYLFRQNYYGPYSDVVTGLLALNNHEVFVSIDQGTEIINNQGIGASRILLNRLDLTTHTITQSRYIGVNDKNNYGKKPVFLDSNKIIFAANRWDANRVRMSSIYAINTNLDSLWYHEYPNEIDPQNYFVWTQYAETNSVLVHDNSIFTAGKFFTNNTPTAFPPGSPNQYAWVMKLDTAGCLTPGCWVNTTDKNGIWLADNPLGLYPNPAHTQVALRLPDAPLPYQIEVYDMHGKLLFDKMLRAADAIINTELFPAATYLCRATYAGQRIGVAKFVVTH